MLTGLTQKLPFISGNRSALFGPSAKAPPRRSDFSVDADIIVPELDYAFLKLRAAAKRIS